MEQPTWGYSGSYKKGTSLFTVVPGNEIISSGPYFLTAGEAFSWGFHYYYFENPESIPTNVLWDELDSIPQSINNVQRPSLDKSLYHKLPPVLIEVKLDKDFDYDVKGLMDANSKLDPYGKNINANQKSLTPVVRDFYNPKLWSLHNSKLALYTIYNKISYQSIAPLPAGIKIDTDLLNSLMLNNLWKKPDKTAGHFWRKYTAFRLSSPQNVISHLVRANLDWPYMILKFLNYVTSTRDNNYVNIDRYLFSNFAEYIVFVDRREFGLFVMDANLVFCIVSHLESRYDFFNLMSTNTKFRRMFNTNFAFQELLIRKFSKQLIPDFFTLRSENNWDYTYNIAASKNENKLGTMGLVLDYHYFSRISKDVSSDQRLLIFKNVNSYGTMIGMVLSLMWDQDHSIDISLRGKNNHAMIKRVSRLPYKKLDSSNIFSRTRTIDANGAVEGIKVNSSWAFDFPSGCVQNLEATMPFLKILKEEFSKSNNILGVKLIMRLYDEHSLKMEITSSFTINKNIESGTRLKILTMIGPYEGLANLSKFKSDMVRLMQAYDVNATEGFNEVALNPFKVLRLQTNNVSSYLAIVYPYISFLIRESVVDDKILRVDLTGDFSN